MAFSSSDSCGPSRFYYAEFFAGLDFLLFSLEFDRDLLGFGIAALRLAPDGSGPFTISISPLSLESACEVDYSS